jgi:hypothetical protein
VVTHGIKAVCIASCSLTPDESIGMAPVRHIFNMPLFFPFFYELACFVVPAPEQATQIAIGEFLRSQVILGTL